MTMAVLPEGRLAAWRAKAAICAHWQLSSRLRFAYAIVMLGIMSPQRLERARSDGKLAQAIATMQVALQIRGNFDDCL
jgi:hypothetical protein